MIAGTRRVVGVVAAELAVAGLLLRVEAEPVVEARVSLVSEGWVGVVLLLR